MLASAKMAVEWKSALDIYQQGCLLKRQPSQLWPEVTGLAVVSLGLTSATNSYRRAKLKRQWCGELAQSRLDPRVGRVTHNSDRSCRASQHRLEHRPERLLVSVSGAIA